MRSHTKISNIGVLLLFPGFFFWHFGLAAGIIPFDSGMYGLVSAGLVGLFLTIFARQWADLAARSPYALWAFGLIAYCSVWVVMHAAISSPPPGTVFQAGAVIVSWFALMSVGAFMRTDAPAFRKILLFLWIAMAAIVLGNVDGLYFDMRAALMSEDSVATYQGFARSMTITSVLILAMIDTGWKRLLFSAASVTVLFFMMARSELYGIIVAILAVESIYAIRRGSHAPVVAFGVAAILFVAVDNLDYLMTSRQLQIFNLTEASSWIARTEAQRIAWQQISDSPFMGVFGGHYYASSGAGLGFYAHNALSAWVNFGLVGFVLYAILIVWAALSSFINLLRTGHRIWRLPVYLNVLALVLVIASKSVFWPVVALGWGVFIGVSHLKRSRVGPQPARGAAAAPHPPPRPQAAHRS